MRLPDQLLICEWLRRNFPRLLIAAGVLLLGYVVSQYLIMHSEQRRLAGEWERQNAALHAAEVTTPDDGLTRLSIPRIELDAIIVDGTSRKQLLVGPGRVKGTALPGEKGNAVITAHRDTFFRSVFNLIEGDEIFIQRSGRTYKYLVTGKKVVPPTEVSVLRPTDEPQLTLITCYPPNYIGPAPERLVVFSSLVQEQPASIPEQTASSAASVAAGGNH